MPYRLHFKGLEIECDTAAELQDAVRTFGSGDGIENVSRGGRSPAINSQWTMEQFGKFLFLLRRPKQKRLFNFLVARGLERATTLDIQRELGVDNNTAI